jgi:hypothetical protein
MNKLSKIVVTGCLIFSFGAPPVAWSGFTDDMARQEQQQEQLGREQQRQFERWQDQYEQRKRDDQRELERKRLDAEIYELRESIERLKK